LRAKEIVKRCKIGGGQSIKSVAMIEDGTIVDTNTVKGKEAKMVIVQNGERGPVVAVVVEGNDKVELQIIGIG
jgi:hypothetical protein